MALTLFENQEINKKISALYGDGFSPKIRGVLYKTIARGAKTTPAQIRLDFESCMSASLPICDNPFDNALEAVLGSYGFVAD